jgi:prepilin-type N-terminal cleavage/methylation domain-containing protein
MIRRLRLDAKRDRGTTLVEMLVTMIVLGFLTTAVTLTVVTMDRNSTTTKARDFATEQSAATVDRASHLIRTATPEGAGNAMFTYAGDTHVTLYSSIGQANGPALVDLNLTGPATHGTLTATITPADANSNYTYTGTPVVEHDGTDIINSTGTPLFTYYDVSGNVLATPMTTVAQLIKIARVKITVVDQEQGLSSAPVTNSTLVYIRNVEYS